MVDRDLVLLKSSAVKRHIHRIELKRDTNLDDFLNDIDRQESISFNLHMAIQNCIDLAAHIIATEGLGVPGSTSEMFYLLEEYEFIDHQTAENMVKAVGFRNLIVHEYGKMDLKKIFSIAHQDINDLNQFLKSIFIKLNISP